MLDQWITQGKNVIHMKYTQIDLQLIMPKTVKSGTTKVKTAKSHKTLIAELRAELKRKDQELSENYNQRQKELYIDLQHSLKLDSITKELDFYKDKCAQMEQELSYVYGYVSSIVMVAEGRPRFVNKETFIRSTGEQRTEHIRVEERSDNNSMPF